RQLAIAALRRHPRLAVELARRRTAEVAGRRVDDAVRHLDLGEHLPLPAEQPQVLSLRLFRAAVGEHLDLLELVHPDDAPGVLAVGAGLAAVAGRPPGIPFGAAGEVKDL